jgi:hypothetical protein
MSADNSDSKPSRPSVIELMESIIQMHREKDAAYRDAWKKRGEQISIMANIARKVDRLEYGLVGAPASRDESLFDTCIDLYVYSLKYLTFLADQTPSAAQRLFGEAAALLDPPYSDGTAAFEWLARRSGVALMRKDSPGQADARIATEQVQEAFGQLEACFTPRSESPIQVRLECAQRLAAAAALLVGAMISEVPAAYAAYVASYQAP